MSGATLLNRDVLLAMEVKAPRPGQNTTQVKVRRAYSDQYSTILVDTAELHKLEASAAARALALARRVARLNPASATIGAGMLASLVNEARAAVAAFGGHES
jgi:hypothetical protein